MSISGLSEKAKGKQRAVELVNDTNDPSQLANPAPTRPSRSLSLTIRFTDGKPDVGVTVEVADTVLDIKRKIRDERADLSRRRLRIIHSGRILADSQKLSEYLSKYDERTTASDLQLQDAKGKEKEEAHDRQVTWLHCSVGAELVDGEEEGDGTSQKPQIKPLRGFDRLAAAGFSEEDIANFRRTFHNQSTGDYLDSDLPEDDEDFEEHARALEERWIESLDGGNSSISSSSNSNTILQGVLLGFFFPLLPFFFCRDAQPAVFWEDGSMQDRGAGNVIFSRRMQMALVLGIALNITFGSWRYLLGS